MNHGCNLVHHVRKTMSTNKQNLKIQSETTFRLLLMLTAMSLPHSKEFLWWQHDNSLQLVKLEWRHFVDNDISWILFFKMGDFSWTLSKGDFSWTLFGDFLWTLLSTRSPLFGWIFVEIFWVNSSGHFLMVIINSANRRGCGAEAPARLSKHCSVPG
jgi:hypothetical protein